MAEVSAATVWPPGVERKVSKAALEGARRVMFWVVVRVWRRVGWEARSSVFCIGVVSWVEVGVGDFGGGRERIGGDGRRTVEGAKGCVFLVKYLL